MSVDVISIRTMSGMVIARGWSYKARLYEDLEDLYLHPTGSMLSSKVVGMRPATPSEDGGDEQDSPLGHRKEAAAWRGKIDWRTRLKPQAWDDEDAGDHVGGLRDVALSLAKLPEVHRRGLVIGDALDALFEEKPYIKKELLRAVDTKIEDATML